MAKQFVTVARESLLKALRQHVSGDDAEFALWDLESPAPRQQIDIVVPPYMGDGSVIANLKGLDVGLIQWQSIGYDSLKQYVPKGIPVANAASVHETSTAELAIGLAIAAQRGLAQFVRNQDAHNWAPKFYPSLADSRVTLLGYGGVGKAVAVRLAGFETQLNRVASVARTEMYSDSEVLVHGVAELPTLLPQTDILIITVPLTEQTRGLINAEMLSHLPDGALVVNVARGAVVDTDALTAEVSSGRLRAALDVVDPEPLPADHPLWSLPGVLITPHVGGDSSAMQPRIVRLIRRQIERRLAGEPPLNLVQL